MPNSPKLNEQKMMEVLHGWRTIAPEKTFGGMTLEQYEAQVNKSLAPRQKLVALEDEKIEQQALRDSEDLITLKKVELVVAGVIADETHGSDSALYESMGYVRKSDRKSGLTRKRVNVPNPN
ncbi:MAG TPA: hypothetical protein VGC76_18245 [Pyrinomonadaceae bacterium]|jgi:hypothetical protein